MFKTAILFAFLCLAPAFAFAQELMIFGGDGEKQFLGCWNCPRYSPYAICNDHSDYASSNSPSSIFNPYGEFGGKNSPWSVWNAHASAAAVPLLVTRNGDFHGYLTINYLRGDAASFSRDLHALYQRLGGDLKKIRVEVCQ